MIAKIKMIFAKKQKIRGGKMKKNLIFAVLVLCVVPMTFGQIVTNGNQSVQYMRMMSRNASTDIDAVYYNPAGLTHMKNGFHLALHNQTIIQNKTVENSYPLLNEATYVGDVNVPIFPNIYAVYKKDKLALFFGPSVIRCWWITPQGPSRSQRPRLLRVILSVAFFVEVALVRSHYTVPVLLPTKIAPQFGLCSQREIS